MDTRFDALWDESPVDITKEANDIWSIANKLRNAYMPDHYGDVIIPMTVLRRFECTLEATKEAVVKKFEENPTYPDKGFRKLSGYQFYNTSRYDLTELCNDPDALAENFKAYINSFSVNVKNIFIGLELEKQIDTMNKNGCLYSVVKAFSEYDLSPATFDSIKMGYIFENLIGRFYQNIDAGQYYTGRDIIKMLVAILISEGCDDIFDNGKVITICDQACGTGGMLSTAYTYIKHYKLDTDVATKSALQIKDILLKSERLRASAKTNSESDFRFSYDSETDEALLSGLEQNQDFFTLLLNDDEMKKRVLGIFAPEVYKALRAE